MTANGVAGYAGRSVSDPIDIKNINGRGDLSWLSSEKLIAVLMSKTTSTYSERRCGNAECSERLRDIRHEDASFCKVCGSAIADIEVEVEVDEVEQWELEEELDGRLWRPFGDFAETLSAQGVHIWVVTAGLEEDKAGRHLFVDDENESLTEVRPADIESELKALSRTWKKELNLLRARYGPSNVSMKWGIIQSICA